MATIGSFSFPPATTTADSRMELILGRVRRVIRMTSVLSQFTSREAFHSALESLSREVERLDLGEVELSLRAGRFLGGRRKKYKVEVDEDRCVAAVSLEVIADDRFEHGNLRYHSEAITSSPQNLTVVAGGNWNALPQIQFNPTSPTPYPHFFDGTRQMTVLLETDAPDVLILDSSKRTATLNGQSVLHATQGDFVELAPGAANLVYNDAGSVHTASLYLFWKDRWV